MLTGKLSAGVEQDSIFTYSLGFDHGKPELLIIHRYSLTHVYDIQLRIQTTNWRKCSTTDNKAEVSG
jgi:hypothetical protein